jgi:hypothetical protein
MGKSRKIVRAGFMCNDHIAIEKLQMAAVSLDLTGGPFAVETSKLSDEDKALLYLSIVMPLVSSPDEGRPGPGSCFRCGKVGHRAGACTDTMLDATTLRQELAEDANKVLEVVAGEKSLVRDEFGFLLPGTFLPDKNCHADGHFCENCARFGHFPDQCSKPTMRECTTFIERTIDGDGTREFADWFGRPERPHSRSQIDEW